MNLVIKRIAFVPVSAVLYDGETQSCDLYSLYHTCTLHVLQDMQLNPHVHVIQHQHRTQHSG